MISNDETKRTEKQPQGPKTVAELLAQWELEGKAAASKETSPVVLLNPHPDLVAKLRELKKK
jgi:hypothetical protein